MTRLELGFDPDLRPRLRWGTAFLTALATVLALSQLIEIRQSVMVNVGLISDRTIRVAALELSAARVEEDIELFSAEGTTQARVTMVERIPNTEATAVTLVVQDERMAPGLYQPARLTFQSKPIWQTLVKWR